MQYEKEYKSLYGSITYQKTGRPRIGRPSTFASLVETLLERGYVKKQDVKGITHKTTNYVLEAGKLKKSTQTKEYGEEKNKLVIQELGVLVLDFLLQYYNPLFSYE